MKNKVRLNDFLVFVAVLAAASAVFFCSQIIRPAEAGKTVEVCLRGEIYAQMPLNTDSSVDVDGLCVVTVSGGEVKVEQAVCKNQLCVRHAPIKRAGEVIICLPAEVTVRILGGPDAVI